MDSAVLISLMLLISIYVVDGQSFFEYFGGRNQNQINRGNQQRQPQYNRQQYNQNNLRPVYQPRQVENQNFQPQFNPFDMNESFRMLELISPGSTRSFNSITNPSPYSSNNVIGNTAYNTVGNRNSVIQNNPK